MDESVAVEDAPYGLEIDLVNAQIPLALLFVPSERTNTCEQLLNCVVFPSEAPPGFGLRYILYQRSTRTILGMLYIHTYIEEVKLSRAL